MTVRHFFAIVELKTKLISVSTFLLATLYAASVTTLAAGRLVLLFVAVLAVDMGTTAFNSFFDYIRNVDNRLFTVERDKVLVYEGVAPGHALIVSVALYAIAAVAGLALAFAVGWWVIAAGAISMIVGFLYTGGPIPISRTPLGELFAGGFLGGVLFLVIAGVLGAPLTREAVVAALPSTLLIASVLTVNNTCDRSGDIAAGRHTLSIVIGEGASEALIYLLGIAAFAIPLLAAIGRAFRARLAAWGPPVGGLPAVIALSVAFVLALAVYTGMHRRGFSHATKGPNMKAILLVTLLFTAAYAVALATGS
ncbi:MAG: prenyltransferase [Spirochaetales bacterium]